MYSIDIYIVDSDHCEYIIGKPILEFEGCRNTYGPILAHSVQCASCSNIL
jgi:hypothetical protein